MGDGHFGRGLEVEFDGVLGGEGLEEAADFPAEEIAVFGGGGFVEQVFQGVEGLLVEGLEHSFLVGEEGGFHHGERHGDQLAFALVFGGFADNGFHLLRCGDGGFDEGTVEFVVGAGVFAGGGAHVFGGEALAGRGVGVALQEPAGVHAGGLGDGQGEFLAEREFFQFDRLDGAGGAADQVGHFFLSQANGGPEDRERMR